MRWVMDVCPLRLLKGRMASYGAVIGWTVDTQSNAGTYRLSNSILVGLPETLRSLVLLLACLVVAGRG